MHSADQLFEAIKYGRRGGQMRYFTYVLLDDRMVFSETGGGLGPDAWGLMPDA